MNLSDLIETLKQPDFDMVVSILNRCSGDIHEPDLTIAPDGEPYLFRWHLFPYSKELGGAYLHIQAKSDPERPLHDHPWDNQSVILSGGYHEIMQDQYQAQYTRERRVGHVIQRRAEEAHRLLLPPEFAYTITYFTMGPKRREWGFWYPDGWHDAARHVATREDGTSIHINEGAIQ